MGIIKGTYTQDTDTELIQSFVESGNLEVLGKLYSRYMELVYGVCLKYFKSPEPAKDAVTDIFEELITKLPKYDIANFRPWLHTLAKNHCLMKLRGNKISPVELTENVVYFDETLHPEDVMNKEGEFNKMEKCIEELPDGQKNAIRLFYLEEKSYREIVEITGIEAGKVRSDIQNGRRNLKNCMERTK